MKERIAALQRASAVSAYARDASPAAHVGPPILGSFTGDVMIRGNSSKSCANHPAQPLLPPSEPTLSTTSPNISEVSGAESFPLSEVSSYVSHPASAASATRGDVVGDVLNLSFSSSSAHSDFSSSFPASSSALHDLKAQIDVSSPGTVTSLRSSFDKAADCPGKGDSPGSASPERAARYAIAALSFEDNRKSPTISEMDETVYYEPGGDSWNPFDTATGLKFADADEDSTDFDADFLRDDDGLAVRSFASPPPPPWPVSPPSPRLSLSPQTEKEQAEAEAEADAGFNDEWAAQPLAARSEAVEVPYPPDLPVFCDVQQGEQTQGAQGAEQTQGAQPGCCVVV